MPGRKPDDDQFEPVTWQFAGFGDRHAPSDLALTWRILNGAGYAMARFLRSYDLLLTPVLAAPPVKIGEFSQATSFDHLLARLVEYVAYTPILNVTGQPAMSVPLHWNADGLPMGVQFMARYGDEAISFRFAAQLEQARPWAGRWPPVSALSAP